MNTHIARLNQLVAEFDRDTEGRFDRLTDPDSIALVASLWPACRRGLGTELALAAGEVKAGKPDRLAQDFDRAFGIITKGNQ